MLIAMAGLFSQTVIVSGFCVTKAGAIPSAMNTASTPEFFIVREALLPMLS